MCHDFAIVSCRALNDFRPSSNYQSDVVGQATCVRALVSNRRHWFSPVLLPSSVLIRSFVFDRDGKSALHNTYRFLDGMHY